MRASRPVEVGSGKLPVSSVEKRVAWSSRTQPNSLDQKPALSLMADSLGEYTTQQSPDSDVTPALPGAAGEPWRRERLRRSGASARRR